MIDLNERVWPEPLLQLFPSNYSAGLLQQNRQHLERLAGEFQSQSCLAQFLRLKVYFKRGKANHLAGADLVWHRWVASIGKSLALTHVCAIRAEADMKPAPGDRVTT